MAATVNTAFLGLRLFIEGIEIPVSSASVTAGLGRPAVCNLHVPASDVVHDFKPRMLVHVFYYNSTTSGVLSPHQILDIAESEPQPYAMDTSDRIDNGLRWALLFAGEVAGYSFQKSAGKRVCVLQCAGFSNYWDSARLYYGKAGTSDKHYRTIMYAGATVARRGKKKVDSSGDLAKILSAQPTTAPTLQGLLGGCVHLLESVMGVYELPRGSDAAKKHRGLNDFYSQTELRLKLTKQLGICPADTSSRNLLGTSQFRKEIAALTNRTRNTASYGFLIRILLKRVFHIYAPVLAPPYIPRGAKAKWIRLVPNSTKSPKKMKGVQGKVNAWVDSTNEVLIARSKEIATRIVKDGDQAFYIKKPGDGGKVVSVADTEGHEAFVRKQKNKIPSVDEVVALQNEVADLATATARKIDDGSATDDDAKVSNKRLGALTKTLKFLEEAALLNQEQLSNKRGSTYGGHTSHHLEKALTAADKADKSRKKIYGRRYKEVTQDIELTDRLITTIFNPTIWWCPPPKCNVVFPSQYSSMKFNRNHSSEITRVWLHGMTKSGRADFSQNYFAPNRDQLIGVDEGDVAQAANKSISFLLPHEKYSGINPSIVGMGDAPQLQKMYKEQTKKEAARASADGVTAGAKHGFIASGALKNAGMAQAAGYKFFEGRYASRSATVSGIFNPGLVCGLPALIIDTRRDPTVNSTHYLGLITGLNHQITQAGSFTSFTMSFCRAHDEGLEDLQGKKDKDGWLTFSKSHFIGGGRTIKRVVWNAGEEGSEKEYIWAEILGWTGKDAKRTETVGGVKTKTSYRKYIPIIGFSGQKNPGSGLIQAALHKQGAGEEPLDVADPTKGDVGTITEVGEGGRRSDTFLVAKMTKKWMNLRMKATYFPHHKYEYEEEMFDTNGKVLKPGHITGYKVKPKLKWMESANVLGAIRVTVKTGGRRKKTKPIQYKAAFEHLARAPWASPVYLNHRIGPDYYQALIGCSSLTDVDVSAFTDFSSFSSSSDWTGTGVVGVHEGGFYEDINASDAQKDTIMKALNTDSPRSNRYNKDMQKLAELIGKIKDMREEDPSRRAVIKLSAEPDGPGRYIPLEILGGVPIEMAAWQLGRLYLSIERRELNLKEFVDSYTARAHATLFDVFGWGAGAWVAGNDEDPIGLTNIEQLEMYGDISQENEGRDAVDGFHSRAFGPYEKMEGLTVESLSALNTTEAREIDKDADPRYERWRIARLYRDSIIGIEIEEGA